MALIGTHQAAAEAILTAKRAVYATWQAIAVARNDRLTDSEIAQMQIEVEAAGLEVLFAHIAAHATVTGTAIAAMGGGPGVPIAGSVG